jgi:arsenate reductase
MTQRVLILCTGNSARSQMAEGLLRHLAGDRFDAFSAGTRPSVVNALAIQAMTERGLDIGQHRSKPMAEYHHQSFDYVITVCDDAAEACPVFPGPAERIHWSFPDPAAVDGDDSVRHQAFREARDAIEERLRAWLATQQAERPAA